MLGSVSIIALGCPGSDMETAPEQQVATVQLGDLTVDIMASGNLALSRVEDLAFDIPGRAGEITVEEILVEVGDSVEEGQLLAKLDTSEWDDMLVNLERDLLQANLDINDRYPLTYGNTQADRLVGMLIWGQALGDPELVHRAIRYGDALPRVSPTRVSPAALSASGFSTNTCLPASSASHTNCACR